MDNFGTGIDLEENNGNGPLRITEVFPGSPAQKAGLRPGDRITAVDGKPVARGDAIEVTLQINRGDLIHGHFGESTVRLTIERDGQAKGREVRMERSAFKAETVFGVQRHDDNSWSYWIDRDRKIAHVRVGALREATTDDLGSALSNLQKGGMRGLLLDLRGCPGGLLTQAVKTAGLFLDKCRVFSGKGRGADTLTDLDNPEPGPFRDLPMIVLVNGDTSGGGELLAAAIQDHKRAPLAGQRTRGKASIQIMLALPARGAYWKLTSAIFLRPSGKNLNRFPDSKPGDDWGVRPNDGLEFRVSAAMNQQVREWWLAQTLRPGSSREVLPLDDPANDPQRQLALQALREQLR
jgi:carboxyl-terminal processing protease